MRSAKDSTVALKRFRSSMCPFLHFEGNSGTKSLKNIGYVIIYLKLLFKAVKYTVIFCQLKLILTRANPIILMQALKRAIEVSSFYCFFVSIVGQKIFALLSGNGQWATVYISQYSCNGKQELYTFLSIRLVS